MRSPFSSRSYTFRAFGSHLPCSSIARMVSRMWACGFPSPLSWMAKSAIMPLETNCSLQNSLSMENYVSSMSNIRRMEDTQPEYKLIGLQPLVSSLYDSAKIICTKNGKELILQNDISVLQLSLDSAFISQVCNNLISNAVRYARTLVTISFTLHDNGLLLSVSDDGNGFDKDSLQKAANPYFTRESNHSEHFGLGLYICKLLCEHHNGYLKIENTATGANVSAYFKSPAL